MANPIFLGQDFTGVSFTALSGEATGYPRTNLLTYFSADKWVSGDSAGGQWIQMNLSSALTADSLMIENTNILSIGASSVTFQAADNSGFTVNVVTLSPTTVSTSPLYQTFVSTTKQYWRITINGTLSAPPYMGNWFIGQRLDFGTPYNYEYEDQNSSYSTHESVQLDGSIKTAQSYAGRQTWSIKFTDGNALSNTTITQFKTFFSIVRGKLRPFYFIDVDSAISYVHLDIDKDPSLVKRLNLNELKSIPLKSQLTY